MTGVSERGVSDEGRRPRPEHEASDWLTTPGRFEQLQEGGGIDVLLALATNPAVPDHLLHALAEHPDPGVKALAKTCPYWALSLHERLELRALQVAALVAGGIDPCAPAVVEYFRVMESLCGPWDVRPL